MWSRQLMDGFSHTVWFQIFWIVSICSNLSTVTGDCELTSVRVFSSRYTLSWSEWLRLTFRDNWRAHILDLPCVPSASQCDCFWIIVITKGLCWQDTSYSLVNNYTEYTDLGHCALTLQRKFFHRHFFFFWVRYNFHWISTVVTQFKLCTVQESCSFRKCVEHKIFQNHTVFGYFDGL